MTLWEQGHNLLEPPPLPHLSGPPPVPRPVKRAKAALVFSVVGVISFVASLVFLGISGGRGGRTISLLVWKFNTEAAGSILLFSCPAPCLAGLVLGLMTRKISQGKAALAAGGTALFFWVLLVGAALIAVSHKIK